MTEYGFIILFSFELLTVLVFALALGSASAMPSQKFYIYHSMVVFLYHHYKFALNWNSFPTGLLQLLTSPVRRHSLPENRTEWTEKMGRTAGYSEHKRYMKFCAAIAAIFKTFYIDLLYVLYNPFNCLRL